MPEREYLEYAQNGAGLDDADLILNVPELKVDSIHLQVEDLEAHVAVQAQVLDLLKLNVGIDLRLGKVRVDVKGVEAQALLKARLDYVAASIDRVLTALDRNPELIESLGSALQDIGWGPVTRWPSPARPSRRSAPAEALEQSDPAPARPCRRSARRRTGRRRRRRGNRRGARRGRSGRRAGGRRHWRGRR